jgi:murein DD-endopeptidase MepM/ murein hydrolase activator NlpD
MTAQESKIVGISCSIGARSFLAFAMVFGSLQPGFARERGPRVEVVCPSPPIPARVAINSAEQQVLVYELDITNFDVAPLTLKQLEVFAGADKKPLKTIAGEALSATMLEVGTTGGAKDRQTIDPGRRAVVFLWIELSTGVQPPRSLRHRMVFIGGTPSAGADGATKSTLEDFQVPVSGDPATVLSAPFSGGVWVAGDGPADDSDHRRSLVAIDGQVHDAQRFAADWVKVGSNGDSHHDGTSRNENWWGYGEPILAVADGEVTQVLDGIPENTPRVLPKEVTLDNIAGNYVILRIAPHRYATYAHLQTRSIQVSLHEHVARGAVIARLGNTGQATAPHLHFQVTDGNSVLQSEGVPFVFSKFTDFGPGSDFEADKHPSTARTDSIPGKDEVVDFGVVKKQ